jgi:Planctomycete cytochrome C
MTLRLPLCLTAFFTAASIAGAVDFKKDIRPILKAKCYACHSEEAKKEKAGYVFDNLERFAGDIGPKGQIVPGDPERSNFLDLLTRDKDPMPPDGKDRLTPDEIKKVRQWIEEGASLDGAAPTAKKPSSSGLAPREPEVPLQDWTNTEGKTIKARYVRISGEAVVIRTADNKSYKVPLAKLSPASQDQAKAAAAAESKPPTP